MGDIKIGNSSITLKLGSANVSAAYLGSTLVYSGGTPPTPSLQWVEFNYGDDISGLDIYGVSGTAIDLGSTFIYVADPFTFDYTKNRVYCNIWGCYEYMYTPSDNVELVFSNIGCNDYYNSMATIADATFKLLIYQ